MCQANYNPLKTEVMAERDDAHLLYLVCRQCGSAVVALVTNGLAGLSSFGMVTDLTSHEVVTMASPQTVEEDDVLALHEWLERDDHVRLLSAREKA